MIELLFSRQEKLRFVSMPMDFEVPEAPARQFHFENTGQEQEIRLWLISHIQNRKYPLPQRMVLLGESLAAMSQALTSGNHQRIEALISGKETLPAPEAITADHDHLRFGLQVANRMLEIMDKRSDSIRAYGEKALRYFGEGESEYQKYVAASNHLAEMIPQWETWFEHMLVNHMFFAQFPFQDRPVDLMDEFIALCAVYILLRFLCVGCMADQTDAERDINVAAAAFRLIDHTCWLS